MNRPIRTQRAIGGQTKNTPKRVDQGVIKPSKVARLTVVTSKNPEVLTKRFSLENGILKKEGGGVLISGDAARREVSTLAEFARLLTRLGSNQALTYGVPDAEKICLTTKGEWEREGKPANVIPRTNETFAWPEGPGILMIDYDPEPETPPLARDELIALLRSAVPALRNVEMLSVPSASSWIKNDETGEWITEGAGQRLYIMVENARDIPRAGKVIFDRLWCAGHGYMKVSSAGTMLSRTLVDGMVWQPSRLDFAAGAECTGPLVQDRGEPKLIAGEVKRINTVAEFPDLTPREMKRVDVFRETARAEKQDEALAKRQAWLENRLDAMVNENATNEQRASAMAQAEMALNGKVLGSDFIVMVVRDGFVQPVTVGEILAQPEVYDRARTRDPIEPDYDDGRLVGMIYLNGPSKTLHSFARGGATYHLADAVTNIRVIPGQLAKAVDDTLAVLRDHPDVFDFGDELVLHERGRVHLLSEHGLNQFLGSVIQYTKVDGKGQTCKVDPPPDVARRLIALRSRRQLKPLSGVITAPTLRLDGTMLDTPGYDHATQLVLYLAPNSFQFEVPDNPTVEDCRVAFDVLWYPFRSFPFADRIDCAVMLAALLTAVIRSVLPTAPAFAFDAPVQGAGKTLLARCVSGLAGDAKPSVHPHVYAEDEIRKRLFALLRQGASSLVWDNVLGEFDSASMAAFLTSPEFSDRVLGASLSVTLPNRVLVMITGNNLLLAGDMVRRVLVSRIDPQTDMPHAREFDLDPLEYVIAHRQQLVCAALTLMRGCLASDSKPPEGSMASFEDWNDLVRNTVVWVEQNLALGDWADPMDAITRGLANDPESETLSELLAALEENFGNDSFSSQEVMQRIAKFSDPARRGISSSDTPEFRLYEALITLNERAVKTTASLGKTLKFRKDRRVDGRALRQSHDAHAKTSRWRVVKV